MKKLYFFFSIAVLIIFVAILYVVGHATDTTLTDPLKEETSISVTESVKSKTIKKGCGCCENRMKRLMKKYRNKKAAASSK